MKYRLKGNYFDGRYTPPPPSGPRTVERFIERICPADLNTRLWEMGVDYSQVEAIVHSAASGYQTWKALSFDKRVPALKRYREELANRQQEIAQAISLESGKPLWEAAAEAGALISKVDTTISRSLPRIQKQTFPEIMPGTTGRLFFKPIGPTLVIGAFNFPCHLANTQILSGLLAGNSVIFKPSEKTAYSAQLMIDCFDRAEFPPGVVNLAQGDGEMARRFLMEKPVKGIHFTGSKEIGLGILKNTCQDLSKLVALELGGKNAAILHRDADPEIALSELIGGAFLTTGQRCTSTALVLAHRSILPSFLSRYHELAKRIVVDHPIHHQKEPFMGPLIDQKALDNYLLLMGMAKREGLQEIMRGKQLDAPYRGHYVTPSIHLMPEFNPRGHFFQSEIFGPNCTFIPYDDLEEAIAVANSTEYGLAASVFSQDRSIFEACAQQLDVGLINFNRSTVGASAHLPFGGVKNSGNYRPMALASIDAAVYQMASLESHQTPAPLKGLNAACD